MWRTRQPEDIHAVGTVGIIMRMLKLPDERIKILVQGLAKGRIEEYIQNDPYYSVRIEKLVETKQPGSTLETEAVMRTVKEQIEKIVSLGKVLIPDVMVVIENLEDPGRLADMVASNLGLKVDITQVVLEIVDPIQRLRQISEILAKEIDVLSMQQKIQAQAKGEMDKTQREYFLREQLKAIQKELGELDERAEEVAEFRKRDHRCQDAGKGAQGNRKTAQAAGENAPGHGRIGHGPHLSRVDGRVALE